MQKANHVRPAIGPARVVLKVGENELGIVTTFLGNGKDAHQDGNDTSKSPEDGSGLAKELVRKGEKKKKIARHKTGFGLTSSQGSHLLPRADTALQRRVMPRKIRKTWYGLPSKTGFASSSAKTLMQDT
jgi:hypothetical protein